MKNLLLQLLCFLFIQNCTFAQEYLSGSITTRDNKTLNCKISAALNGNTPTSIKSKDENGNISKSDAFAIKGFEVLLSDGSKRTFIARTVKINKSSTDINELENNAIPTMVEEHIFLQEVYKSNISLYVYNIEGQQHYFLNYNGKTEELIRKSYRRKSDGAILESNLYRKTFLDLAANKTELAPEILRLAFSPKDFINMINKIEGNQTNDSRKSNNSKGRLNAYIGVGYLNQSLFTLPGSGFAYTGGVFYNFGKLPRARAGFYLNFNTFLGKYHTSFPIKNDPFKSALDLNMVDHTFKMNYFCFKPTFRFDLVKRKEFRLYSQLGMNIGLLLNYNHQRKVYNYPTVGEQSEINYNIFPAFAPNWGSTVSGGIEYKRFGLEFRNDNLNGGISRIQFYGRSVSLNLNYRIY